MKKRLDALWSQLLQEHAAPSRLALGVFVGCVVGASPFLGLHLLICILLALLLRLNKLVIYAAANISIMPLAPFLAFASAQIGAQIRHGQWLDFSMADFRARPLRELAHELFFDWLVGGAVLGAAIGVVLAAVVYIGLSRRRARDRIDAAITRATERYRGLHPRLFWYARMKYRMDPVYRAVASRVPPGTLTIDLGAGLGMLATLLSELGEDRTAISVEWDETKAGAAEHAAGAVNGVRRGDITRLDVASFPRADVLTIIDVLHYFDDAGVARVLDDAVALLSPNGIMLIREGDGGRSGGSSWTRFVESLAVRAGWNRAHRVEFREAAALGKTLQARGLHVEVQETSGRLHPGNVLFICRFAAVPTADRP